MSRSNLLSRLAPAILLMCVLAACGGNGYTRGVFHGYVIDRTQEEITSKFGKPDSIDGSNPASPKWVYKGKTFDPENQNKSDNETILIFVRDPASGTLKVKEVDYS